MDTSTVEGAYNVFRTALVSGDEEVLWASLTPATHKQFDDAFDSLRQMDTTIDRFLPTTDHQVARRQSGAELLEKVTSGKELFQLLFRESSVPTEEGILLGLDGFLTETTEADSLARVYTKACQQERGVGTLIPFLLSSRDAMVEDCAQVFILAKGEDGVWTPTNIDQNSSGFEHVSKMMDMDGDGTPELYVAADKQRTLSQYSWNAETQSFDKKILGSLPSGFTWNLEGGSL